MGNNLIFCTGPSAGSRVWGANIAGEIRKFNVQEGLTSDDDRLSKGLFRKLGDSKARLTHEEYEMMLEEYYEIRGWALYKF
jgi:aldehyde:ferredoxin oxidoreductase